MINGTLKVTTEELVAKAADVNKCIAILESHFNTMNETVKRSSRYWKGEASNIHRKTFVDKQPVFEAILKRFSEHTKDLSDMARNYETAETTIQKQNIQELPKDIIV